MLLMSGLALGQANTEWRTPLDFGALGDGIRDDSAELQEAIDGNLPVHLAGRTYRITSPLHLSSGAQLLGPGVLHVDFDSASSGENNSAIVVEANNVTISALTIAKDFIDGSSATAILGRGASALTVRSVTIEGFSAGQGIWLEDCRNFSIIGNDIGGFVVGVDTDLLAKPMAGILLERCKEGLITGNTLDQFEVSEAARGEGYLSYCIYSRESERIAILDNRISFAGEGIHFEDSLGATVSRNVLIDIWSYAVRLVRSSFTVVSGNHISEAYQGVSIAGAPLQPDPECVVPDLGTAGPLEGLVGSVEGGIEDPAAEGDTLVRLGDGVLSTRATIEMEDSGSFSFVVDLLQQKQFSDLTLVSAIQYRSSGQFPGGVVSLAVSNSHTGPFIDAGSARLECGRPPAGGMTDERPGACATMGEARRIVLDEPINTRYVKVSASYCTDNSMLMSEAYANHGPIVYRMRPIGADFQNGSRSPALMADGDTSTYFDPSTTTGFIDLDVSPYPVEIERINLIGRLGALSGLPRVGEVLLSETDYHDGLESQITSFNLEPENGKVSIDLPAGSRARFVRIKWDSIQDSTDTRTQIAEITVDSKDPCIPQDRDYSIFSNGNAVNGNVILNPGSKSIFGEIGTARFSGSGAHGIDLGGNANYSIVSDHIIADTQAFSTMESGINSADAGLGNTITDNISTYDFGLEVGEFWMCY